jgi:LacI family transcriptional regulator
MPRSHPKPRLSFRTPPTGHRVALGVGPERGYGQRALEGIIDYAREYGPWEFVTNWGSKATQNLWESFQHCDGMIAVAHARELLDRLENQPKPVVLAVQVDSSLPQIYPDDPAVGKKAATYFAGRGYRDVAFIGYDGVHFSDDRRDALRDAARRAGLVCHVFAGHPWVDTDLRDRWLNELPKPVGLLCCNAQVAHGILNVLWDLGLVVPEDLAVLGVDDDPLLCELSSPPLSVIDHGAYEIGYRAAEMLDAMLAGGDRPGEPVAVQPGRVIERQSTDAYALKNPAMIRAVRRIRTEACNGLTVADVVRHAGTSRRTLEQGFRRELGRGIWQEIVRVRVERARDLLRQTDLPTPDVAARSGFSSASKLADVFRRTVGQTPTEFRRARRP